MPNFLILSLIYHLCSLSVSIVHFNSLSLIDFFNWQIILKSITYRLFLCLSPIDVHYISIIFMSISIIFMSIVDKQFLCVSSRLLLSPLVIIFFINDSLFLCLLKTLFYMLDRLMSITNRIFSFLWAIDHFYANQWYTSGRE